MKAILFDMDGVLIDSEELMAKSGILALRDYGIDPKPEDFVPFVGRGENKYIGGVAEKYGLTFVPEMKARAYHYYGLYVEDEAFVPGDVHAVLEAVKAKGYKIAVCTSADYAKVVHNLRAIGSNQAIANSVGLDSDKIKFAVFTIGGLFLGIGAFLYISNAGEQRNVSAMGSMTIMMDGFMGMFIAMFIAKYCDMSIAVVLGTFTMKMLSNGFVAMGLSSTVRDIIQGIFLLVLLVISANAGLFERMRADKAFKAKCEADYAARQTT